MDFKDLVYLDAIDRHRSLTRAAKELYMTQPALSNFLRGLESSLNTELFRRNGNTLEPTPAGSYYLDFARKTLAEKELLDRKINLYAYGKGQIRIGIPFSRTGFFVDALIKFSQKYPDTEVLLIEGSYLDLDEQLKSCQLDLIFTNNPDANASLKIVPLQTDEFLLYNPEDPPGFETHSCNFSSYPWVDIQQFSERRFLLPPEKQVVGTISRAVFRECEFQPKQIFPISSIPAMLSLVQKGYGICLFGHPNGRIGLLPASEHRHLYAFGTHAYTSQFSAVYLSQLKYPDRVQAFVHIVQQQFQT